MSEQKTAEPVAVTVDDVIAGFDQTREEFRLDNGDNFLVLCVLLAQAFEEVERQGNTAAAEAMRAVVDELWHGSPVETVERCVEHRLMGKLGREMCGRLLVGLEQRRAQSGVEADQEGR